MEITGIVKDRTAERGGTSQKGNPWRSIDYLVEYDHGQYPKCIALTFMNDRIDEAAQLLHQGTEATFKYEVNARVFTGTDGVKKFFNSLTCYQVTLTAAAQPQQPAQPAAQATAPPNPAAAQAPANDDLPF